MFTLRVRGKNAKYIRDAAVLGLDGSGFGTGTALMFEGLSSRMLQERLVLRQDAAAIFNGFSQGEGRGSGSSPACERIA